MGSTEQKGKNKPPGGRGLQGRNADHAILSERSGKKGGVTQKLQEKTYNLK